MDVKGLSHFSPLCLGNRAWNQCLNPKMAAKLGELLNSLTVWQRQPPFWDTKSRKTVVSKRLGKKKKKKKQPLDEINEFLTKGIWPESSFLCSVGAGTNYGQLTDAWKHLRGSARRGKAIFPVASHAALFQAGQGLSI